MPQATPFYAPYFNTSLKICKEEKGRFFVFSKGIFVVFFKLGFIEQIQDTEIQDTRYRTAVTVRLFHILYRPSLLGVYLVTCISPKNRNLPFKSLPDLLQELTDG